MSLETFINKINLTYLINKIGDIMEAIMEMGKISSRGQIAIPLDIRQQLGLEEGSKVLFFTDEDTLLVKKITPQTFAQITKPFKEAAKKARLEEKDVSSIVQRARKSKR